MTNQNEQKLKEGLTPPKLRIIPPHLRGFYKLYKILLSKKFFEELEEAFKENEEGIPEEMAEYGIKLIRLTLEEPDIQKKYDHYQALKHFIDYLWEKL